MGHAERKHLRQNVTTYIATGGQHDVMIIGTSEVSIWGKQGWLVGLNDLPAIRGGLTVDGTLLATPFCGKSSMVKYLTALMKTASMAMPAAAALTNTETGVCLHGKAGWLDREHGGPDRHLQLVRRARV